MEIRVCTNTYGQAVYMVSNILKHFGGIAKLAKPPDAEFWWRKKVSDVIRLHTSEPIVH